MKVGRTYEDFFSSFGGAIIACTLLVSIGKLITDYYLLYIVVCSLLIMISLMIYDYKYKGGSRHLKEAGEEQYASVMGLATSKKKHFNKMASTSLDSYSENNDKELDLRQRILVNKEDRQTLKEGDVIHMHLPINKQQLYAPGKNDSYKRDGKSSTREIKRFLKVKGKVAIFLRKEMRRSSVFERHEEIINHSIKEEKSCTTENGFKTLV